MTLLFPSTPEGRAGLSAMLADPAHALLAMDFDGTLAPIVAEADRARVHVRAPGALRRLAAHLGGLAVITGRPTAFVVGTGGLGGTEDLVVLGHYGLERWERGRVSAPEPPGSIEAARRELPGLLGRVGAPEGTAVEDKGLALAVHVRRTADPPAAFALLSEPLALLAAETGLRLEPGRLVLELRPPGMDKGRALQSLVDELPGGGSPAAVVFVGDDLGDLPAFDEVQRLRGRDVPGLLVCSGSPEVEALAERADLLLDGPDGVMDWLEALAQSLDPTDECR